MCKLVSINILIAKHPSTVEKIKNELNEKGYRNLKAALTDTDVMILSSYFNLRYKGSMWLKIFVQSI